jgi:hypothetical protein
MRDLYRCLDEYAPELLLALAEAWQVSLAGLADGREMAVKIASAMLAPEAMAAMAERLSPSAREVLGELVAAGGKLPGHRLALAHGAIRRFGPARLLRERPWAQPQGALEELYYRGLLYRTYGTSGDALGEVLHLPQQVFDGLAPAFARTPALAVGIVAAPPLVLSDGDALYEDVLALLAWGRRGQLRPLAREGRGASGARAPFAFENAHGRLSGEATPERLALLWRVLVRQRLLHEQGGLLRPTLRAREWLLLPAARRARNTYLAWREDEHAPELRLLPHLRFAEGSGEVARVAVLRAFTEVLALCPAEEWLSLDALIQALKRRRPDYLRPDGDYDTWRVRDAQTGADLSGFAAWERIEGALARYLISGPLRWLGVVELGSVAANTAPHALRLTAAGARLLAQEPPVAAEAALPSPPVATITAELSIRLPLAQTLYERYQLERFAEWQGQDTAASYRISAESIWASQNEGIKIEQIVAFLKRLSGDQVSGVVLRTLHAWGGRFGRVTMRSVVLLEAADEQTMQQLYAHAEVRALLGEALSPTRCLVAEENVALLTQRLKALGIWPAVRTSAAPGRRRAVL